MMRMRAVAEAAASVAVEVAFTAAACVPVASEAVGCTPDELRDQRIR